MSVQRYLVEEVRRKKDKDRRAADKAKADQLLSSLFKQQRDFVLDRSRRKAALCPRRAGKSYCCLAYALIVALRRPGAQILILARVRRQAKAIYWLPIKQLLQEYGFDPDKVCKNMDLEVHLPNGSIIYFAGADTQEETDKYRGRQLDLCIIDEGKSYASRILDELITEVIRPALADRRGTLAIIGTPGCVLQGLFWAITTQQKSYRLFGAEKATPLMVERYHPDRKGRFQWSLHKWHSKDNVAMPHIWQDALEEKEVMQWADDDPFWVREYLGEWVADDNALVYSYYRVEDDRCAWVRESGPHGLPPKHEWRYLLGVDLGWHDDTAFVVGAWSPTHPVMHYVHVEKHPYMNVFDVSQRVRELEKEYGGFDAVVCDTAGAGKQIAEGLAEKYGLSVVAAKKSEKCAHIALLNADITGGRVKLDPDGPLAQEWLTAQWGNADKTEVDRSCDDHASDAALYLWRYAHHHWFQERQDTPEEGSQDWYRNWERKEKQRAQAEAKEKQDPWKRHQSQLNRLPMAASRLTRWKH